MVVSRFSVATTNRVLLLTAALTDSERRLGAIGSAYGLAFKQPPSSCCVVVRIGLLLHGRSMKDGDPL